MLNKIQNIKSFTMVLLLVAPKHRLLHMLFTIAVRAGFKVVVETMPAIGAEDLFPYLEFFVKFFIWHCPHTGYIFKSFNIF